MSKERLDNLLQSIHLEKAAEADSESTYALSSKLREEPLGSKWGETHAFSELEPEPWT